MSDKQDGEMVTSTSSWHQWYLEVRAKRVVESLIKNNVGAEYVTTGAEALDRVKAIIPEDATVGIGGSATLEETGIISWLQEPSRKTVFNPFAPVPEGQMYDAEMRFDCMRKALVSDIFLCSCNAVTLDGKLVNTDAEGNRVAAMLFGPRKTIMVVGANKIVEDVDEALKRIKSVCAPMGAKRHVLQHGYVFFDELLCAITGSCANCRTSIKGCRKTVIIDGQFKLQMGDETWPPQEGIYVIMVGEGLGI